MVPRRLTLGAIRLTTGLVLSLAWSALAQMQPGERMKDYHTELGLGDVATFEAILLEANAPANIFWPGERPELRFQLRHRSAEPWKGVGHVEVVEWATEGIPGDIWLPQVRERGQIARRPIEVHLPAAEGKTPGWQNLTVTFDLPDRNLGWAAVLDLGDKGRQLLTHGVRTFAGEDLTMISSISRCGFATTVLTRARYATP